MPPLPTIADVYRVTLNWGNVAGVVPRNVFHIGNPSGDVAAVAEQIGNALSAHTDDGLFAFVSTAQECTNIDVLPLDGTTATFNFSLANLLTGAGAGEIIPQGAAVLSLHSATRGPRGRGRMYIGPVRESTVDDGILDNATKVNLVDIWGELQEDLSSQVPPSPIVVASYVHEEAQVVTSFSMDEVMGTQRRRADQLR